MKLALFILLCSIVYANAASIAYYAVPTVRHTLPIVYGAHSSSMYTPTQQQFLHQDDLGQYSYGYTEPLSSKGEVRSLDGTTRGFYSYLDAAGKLQIVDYTADSEGFHVAATNLPRSVRQGDHVSGETMEVAAARKAHFAAHANARIRLSKANNNHVDKESNEYEVPHPVADTAEVAAAKQAHLERLEHEKIRNEMVAQRSAQLQPLTYPSAISPGYLSYSYPFNSRFYYY